MSTSSINSNHQTQPDHSHTHYTHELRLPVDTAFKQQRIAACQPKFTNVAPVFLLVGILLIPLGIALFSFSNSLNEKEIDYTDCMSTNNKCKCSVFVKHVGRVCTCKIEFELKTDFAGPVYMYYGLTNFYQNHRFYLQSKDNKQLYGKVTKPEGSSDCVDPYKQNGGAWYWPCGAVANSMFQDDIALFYYTNSSNYSSFVSVQLQRTGIIWIINKDMKYKNPSELNETTFDNQHEFIKPKDWVKEPFSLDTDKDNNGVQNEDFIIWMRTAALSNFRKLYRIVGGGMRKGKYRLAINYSFQVTDFEGTKSIIFSTRSVLGSKNSFFGIIYMAVGGICLVIGAAFCFAGCRRRGNTP